MRIIMETLQIINDQHFIIFRIRIMKIFRHITLSKFAFSTSLSTNTKLLTFDILDVKNNHLVYVKDSKGDLPYFSQIKTSQGDHGVVIKLQERGTTVIGMYNNLQFDDKIQISNVSLDKVERKQTLSANNIYDINFQSIGDVKDVNKNSRLQSQFKKQGKRLRIQSLSSILTLNSDIFVGDFAAFTGPLGSGRTHNAIQIIECFTNSNLQNSVGLYLNTNPNDFINSSIKAASKFNTICFGRVPNVFNPRLTQNMKNIGSMSSVGVYMLAVKSILAANKLKNQGQNVLLVIDNLHEILANEWTILQTLKLPLSPFSILNQIYSLSSDNSLNKGNEGSLTTIAITTPENQDILQQYTTLGNNNKYLKTLSNQITFPLQLSMNNNQISSSTLKNEMRANINRLLRDKKQKQLLHKLKLGRDEPWENYYILDSQWWSQSLKTYRPKDMGDRDLFLWFINKNINEDYCAHWKIPCNQCYTKYIDFLASPEDLRLGMDQNQFDHFINICKSEGYFDVYKKDYLN